MSDFQRKRNRRLKNQMHLQDRMAQLAEQEATLRRHQGTNQQEQRPSRDVTGPNAADGVGGDSPSGRSLDATTLLRSNDRSTTSSFYRAANSTDKSQTATASPNSQAWKRKRDEKNLHPRDGATADVAAAAPKRPKDTSTSTESADAIAPKNGWDVDNDDDDDDDIFGGKSLLAKFRRRKQQLQQQQQQKQGTSSVTADATAAAAVAPPVAESQDSATGLKENGLRITKKGVPLEFSDDDNNENDQHQRIGNNIRRRRRSQEEECKEETPTPISQENSIRSTFERGETHDSASDEDEDSDDEQPQQRRKGAPRNPTALQREKDAAFQKQSSERRRFSGGDSDGFMSDCDPPLNSDERPKSKPKARRKRGRSESIGSSPEKNRKKLKYDSDENDDDDSFHALFAEDSNSAIDDEGSEALKPTLPDPKFGPYEPMEPLVLRGPNGSKAAVPASLNRYLAPFQKQGVEFMYQCLARRSGVILGDEMGLGKTVQVIALLCALFEKTGTAEDLTKMRERNKKVSAHLDALRILADEALTRGEVVEEDDEEWINTLELSPWHPVIVIVPPSVMEAWKQSFETFSHFSVSVYSSRNGTNAIKAMRFGKSDVLLCPKSLFQTDFHFELINVVNWKLVVIDEFHNYKSEAAKLSKNLRDLKLAHTPLVLGMTGTLMQNNHKELWNLVDLVQTNFFGTKDDFGNSIANPIALGRQKGAEKATVERSEKASKSLRTKLAKIMIERFKKDVLGEMLPQKSERVIFCSLSKLQKEVYRHVVELPDFDLVKKASTPCDCGINQNFFRKFRRLRTKAEQLDFYRNNKNQIVPQSKCHKKLPLNPRRFEDGEPKIDPDAVIWRTLDKHSVNDDAASNGCEQCPRCCSFACMTKLMKLSSHLGLLQANKTPDASTRGSPSYVKYMKEREFAKVALAGVVNKLPGGDYDRNGTIMDDHISLSGKLDVMSTLLKKYLSEGSRVLLFAHSTQTLDLIQNFIQSLGTMTFLRMDGQTDQKRRQALADQFNDDPAIFLFLLSTKAAGQGLTLTGANRVILFEQSWNPSWEDQAQDRAHRIGQSRDVDVVRLVAQGTVEEMIYLRQIYKLHLKQDTLTEVVDANAAAPRVFRGVQGDSHRKGELFGFENLFRFKDGSFLEDIWAEAGGNGLCDSSGLRIHRSDNLASFLLGNGDHLDFESALEEQDNVSLIQAMSQHVNSPKDHKNTEFAIDDSDSEESEDEAEEPLEKKVRAVNHGDLFRMDKGGAAIREGDEGFDEEMGGATQDAYAVYEERKESLCDDEDSAVPGSHHEGDISDNEIMEDTGGTTTCNGKPSPNSSGVNDNTTKKQSPQPIPSAPLPEIAPVVPLGTISKSFMSDSDAGHSSNSAVVVPSTTDALVGPETCDPPKGYAQDMRQNVPSSLLQSSKTAKANNRARSKKMTPTSMLSTHQNGKIQLAGVHDVENAKTEFSISDLQLPTYTKKKKKKKRKSP